MQVSKVVAEGYVLVVAGIYCQQLHFIHHHSSTAWTTIPKASPVLSGVYPAVCCPSAIITTTKPLWSPCQLSLLSDYAQSLIFQKNLKEGGSAVCAVLLVRVIPHHTFVLPALIGHISTPDVSGYTTQGRTFGSRNQT